MSRSKRSVIPSPAVPDTLECAQAYIERSMRRIEVYAAALRGAAADKEASEAVRLLKFETLADAIAAELKDEVHDDLDVARENIGAYVQAQRVAS